MQKYTEIQPRYPEKRFRIDLSYSVEALRQCFPVLEYWVYLHTLCPCTHMYNLSGYVHSLCLLACVYAQKPWLVSIPNKSLSVKDMLWVIRGGSDYWPYSLFLCYFKRNPLSQPIRWLICLISTILYSCSF